MRKLALMLSLAMMLGAFSVHAQTKTVVKKKSSTEQTQVKSEKPIKKEPVKKEAKENKKIEKKTEKAAVTDKVVPGKKGPEGQPVYEGQKGGHYYINKNGNKTYLKK
jgi:colicin import membrane protein